ncbi:MAG: hypothetical protein U1E05_10420, partial [Patescibacteria group bacterium]|nr:hypothetical protein [Patescibacteria group bacterium]
LDLCTAAITDKSRTVTPGQRSYAHFRRGRNYYCLDGEAFDPDAAFNDYAADWLANVGPDNRRAVPTQPADDLSSLRLDTADFGRTGFSPSRPGRTNVHPTESLSPRAASISSVSLPSIDQTGYAIYLRAGLVAYLSERPTEAVEWFERAKPFEPERNFVVVHGEIPTGIERLIAAARSGKSLTPEEARRGDEKARLILMLADVYHEGEQWEKSLDLCTAAITDKSRTVTPGQRSYAHFRRGRNYYCLDGEAFDPDAAFNDYAAAVRTAPKAPWARQCLLLAANISWNHRTDATNAIQLWERLVNGYPNSDEADRACYFIGVVHEIGGRPDAARKAYETILAKQAISPFTDAVRQRLRSLPTAEETPGTNRPGAALPRQKTQPADNRG